MLGMTKYHVREMLDISRDMKSLDAAVAPDSELTFMETIDSGCRSPEEDAIEIAMKDEINRALLSMDSKSAQVIAMRYGLNGYGERTLKEIGEKMNLSRERIRQIEKKALGALKTYSENSKSLGDYVAV